MKRLLLMALLLSGCSSSTNNPDPNAQFNRDMLRLNMCINENVMQPVTDAYEFYIPTCMRYSISSFSYNWYEPLVFVNHVLALDFEKSFTSLLRFILNTTIGMFGLFDVAEQIGLERVDTNYSATLHKWGVPTGDYLVLPILGPSSTRDSIAEPISWFADPVTYLAGFPWMIARKVVSMICVYSENKDTLNATLQNSLDNYSLIRSAYMQKYGDASAVPETVEVLEEE